MLRNFYILNKRICTSTSFNIRRLQTFIGKLLFSRYIRNPLEILALFLTRNIQKRFIYLNRKFFLSVWKYLYSQIVYSFIHKQNKNNFHLSFLWSVNVLKYLHASCNQIQFNTKTIHHHTSNIEKTTLLPNIHLTGFYFASFKSINIWF